MTSFVHPTFDLWEVVYTAIGVSVFWAKWGRTKLRPYVFPDLVRFLRLQGQLRAAVEFLIFLVVGCVVAIGVANPHGPVQAITAGFGWTGVFSHPNRG